MLKKISFSIMILCLFFVGRAQQNDTKTVLFLIPFFGNQYHAENINAIESETDIYNESVFSLVSFWEGACLALDEYESGENRINVIVRDVTNDNGKLLSIMEDKELMSRVDLIIGPFFARQFELAAFYAKKYQIPIVNPFTTKKSIVNGNEFVYKVFPAHEAMPEKIFARGWTNQPVFFLTESDKWPADMQIFKDYFDAHNVKYEKVSINTNIIDKLKSNTRSLVLVSIQSEAMVIAKMRQLGIHENGIDATLVIPQEWLDINELEVDYLNKLNVHFFSNYFVDENSDASVVFMDRFSQKYNSNPDLQRFTFQGYDITKYFVELMLHDFEPSKVDYVPVSMQFNFKKVDQGGFENTGVFFMQLQDYQIKPTE